LPEDMRYADPDLEPAKRAGEIDKDALKRIRAALPFTAGMDDVTLLDWFGRFITRYRSAQTPLAPAKPVSEAALMKQLAAGASLLRHPWSRFAWARHASRCTLFANGHAYSATARWAQQLCSNRTLSQPLDLNASERALVLSLVNDGHLIARKLRNRRT
jgi:50S ribosomal protein L16 3-hydroxylase